MAKGTKPDYPVKQSTQVDRRSYYRDKGAAWINQTSSVSIMLNEELDGNSIVFQLFTGPV
jgi:hypothetical protein